jgi:ADP-heptose:LPS heptosyltransferase
MKIKLSVPDKDISPEAQQWLKDAEDKMNSSKLLKEKMLQIILTGSSTITDEEIIAEIKNAQNL